MPEILLVIFFALLTLYYCWFLLVVYKGLDNLKIEKGVRTELKVSIIIPFRNESENILKNYESISSQVYPIENLEVVYVNDNSDDDSLEKLCKQNYSPHIKVLSVPQDYSQNAHKKRAIRYGIENSSGEIIVTTDADCFHNQNWLKTLLAYLDDETGFVSGPVQFEEQNNFFAKLQRLEFAGLVITGAGLIGADTPAICNAANIAYRRKAYDEVGGFSFQMDLSSGDDELLMQKIHTDTNYKVAFAATKHALVTTEPNKNISEFFNQRKRWASKGLFYRNLNLKIKLVIIFLFYISLIIQPLLAILFLPLFLISFLSSFLLKMIFEFVVIKKGEKLLFKKKVLQFFFLAEILQIPYIIIAGISGAFGNLVWKERRIKR